jgi:hypothetical protein
VVEHVGRDRGRETAHEVRRSTDQPRELAEGPVREPGAVVSLAAGDHEIPGTVVTDLHPVQAPDRFVRKLTSRGDRVLEVVESPEALVRGT